MSLPPLLDLSTAVQKIEAYDDGLNQSLRNIGEMRSGTAQVIDALDTFDRAIAKIEGLRDELDNFGDDIGKLRIIVRLMGKAGALKTIAKAGDELLETIETKSDQFEAKVTQLVDKLKKNPIKTTLDSVSDKVRDVDDRLAGVEKEVASQKASFGQVREVVGQTAAFNTTPIQWAGTLVQTPAALLTEINQKYADAKKLLDDFGADVPESEFQHVINLDAAVRKVTSLLDGIRKPLNEVYKLLKPIEPLLAAVDKLAALTIDPVIDKILDTIGIGGIIDDAKARVSALLPSIDVLDFLDAAYDKAAAALTDFDLSGKTYPVQQSGGGTVDVPDPLEVVEWIEESLKDKLQEFLLNGAKTLIADAGLSAGGFGLAIEIPPYLPGADTTQPPLNGSDNDDDLTALIHDIVMVGDQHDNVITALGGENMLIGGPGNDELIGVDGSDDYLVGGQGNDILRGGAGANDTALYFGDITQYVVSREDDTSPVVVEHISPIPGVSLDGRDTLYDIEHLEFANRVVTVATLLANQQRVDPGGSFLAPTPTQNPDGSYDPAFLFAAASGLASPPGVALTGSLGNDIIAGGAGDDSLVGNEGNDSFNGGGGDDFVDGGPGSDTFTYFRDNTGGGHDIEVDLVDGRFHLNGKQSATLQSIENISAEDDTNALLFGDAKANGLTGGLSDDLIDGRAGNDWISGGPGNDILIGGPGKDALFGGDGNDYLVVGDQSTGAAQRYDGGAGNDTLDYSFANAGQQNGPLDRNFLTGNSGFNPVDRAKTQVQSGPVRIFAGEGRVERLSADGTQVLVTEYTESIETFIGSESDDELWGGMGDKAGRGLDGAGGDDVIHAGDTTTEIRTGAGVDTVYAGIGGASYYGDSEDWLFLNAVADVRWRFKDIGSSGRSIQAFLATDDVELKPGSGTANPTAGRVEGFGTIIGSDFDDEFNISRAGTSGLSTVVIYSGDGDDDFVFHRDGSTPSNGQVYEAHGGDGNDSFDLYYRGHLEGGDGDDSFRLHGSGGASNGIVALGDAGSDIFYVDRVTGLVDGGAGTDIVSAFRSNPREGLTVDLVANLITYAGDASKATTVAGIEMVIGSDEDADLLGGGVNGETLIGAGGNDILEGRAGIRSDRDAVSYHTTTNAASQLPLDGSWTVEAWVQTTDLDQDYNRIVTRPLGGAQTFSILVRDGLASVRFDRISGGAIALVGGFVADGDTHHIAGKYDETDSSLTLFVDGVVVDQLNNITSEPREGLAEIFVGRFSEAYDQYFDGVIEEVRVWDMARTDAEIDGVQGGVNAANEPDLKILYTGGTADDPTLTVVKGAAFGLDLVDRRSGDDLLYGGVGNDQLYGGDGDDFLHGGVGIDAYFGGAGSDTVSYAAAAPGGDAGALELSEFYDVTVDLAAGTGTVKIVVDAANVTVLNSTLRGVIFPSFSPYSTQLSTTTIQVVPSELPSSALNLLNNLRSVSYATVTDTTADRSITETIDDIENVVGGAGDDTLLGDQHGNNLRGGTGNDNLIGRAGDDFFGLDGNDAAYGGAGDDTFFIGPGNMFIDGETGLGDTLDFGKLATRLVDISQPGGGTAEVEQTVERGLVRYDLVQGFYLADFEIDVPVWADTGTSEARSPADPLLAHLPALTPQEVLEADPGFANSADDATRVVPDEGQFLITMTKQIQQFRGDFTGIEEVVAAAHVEVLQITPTNGNDVLRGGLTDDILTGLAGNDRLIGDLGDDELSGGAGNDIIDGGDGNDLIYVDSALDQVDGGAGSDRVVFETTAGLVLDLSAWIGIERVDAGDGDDVLDGSSLTTAMKILAGAGDDMLKASVAPGFLNGQGGRDTVSFIARSGGVGVNLQKGTSWMGAADDTLVSIEHLIGTAMADALAGNAEDNSLDGDAGDDMIWGGAGNDMLRGGEGDDMLNGQVGHDTASFAGLAAGVGVHLAKGTSWKGAAGDTLISIESLIGSDHDDILFGDGGGNMLDGGDGDDRLWGGAGNDLLRGGLGRDEMQGQSGNDTVSYAGQAAGVGVNLAQGTTGHGAAGDVLVSIENLIGSGQRDILVGDDKSNLLEGGDGDDDLWGSAGDDILNGGAGADRLQGQVGRDTASFAGMAGGVGINLAKGLAWKAASGDVLVSIEDLIGTDFDDVLIGDLGDNRIDGGLGDDSLWAGGGDDILNGGPGSDLLQGQAGTDTATYETEAGPVGANLATGAGWKGAAGDTLVSIENLTGSDFDDTLLGDGNANVLQGRSGDDTLLGRAGNDILRGGTGADILDGQAGDDVLTGGGLDGAVDTFVFTDNAGSDRILGWEDGFDLIDVTGITGVTGFADVVVDQSSGTDTAVTAGAESFVIIGFTGPIDQSDFV